MGHASASDTGTIQAPPELGLLTRKEVAGLAKVTLSAIDKAIESHLIEVEHGSHGTTLLASENAILISLLSGNEITLSRDAKERVKVWIYEEQPHRSSGTPELALSQRLILRCDAEIKKLAKKIDRYLDGRMRYIERNPHVFGGEPIIKGTRLQVRAIADRVTAGDSIETVMSDYPHLPRKAIETAILYAETHPRRGRPRKPWRDSSPAARSS